MSALENTAINKRGVQCNAYRSGIFSTSYIDPPAMNIHNLLSFISVLSWELQWKTRPSSRKTSEEVAPSSSVTSERTTSVSWFRLIATVSGHHGDCLWIILSTSHLPFLISAWSNAWLTDCPPIWIRRIIVRISMRPNSPSASPSEYDFDCFNCYFNRHSVQSKIMISLPHRMIRRTTL